MNPTARVVIESIDIEGKGIARIDGKTIFIRDVLANEEVDIEIYKRKSNFDLGRLINIITPSVDRIKPECPHFGVCGGCSMQHLEFNAQIAAKEKVLIDNLKHIGKVAPDNILEPLKGIPWNYRHRARLSARYVTKKGGALVGFREKGTSYVADMNECRILPKHISDLIPHLRSLLGNLLIKEKIPQIEVAVGNNVTVLVFRIMEPLDPNDQEKVKQFVDTYTTPDHPLQTWLQDKGPDSCKPFYPLDAPSLSYKLDRFNIDMPFYPTEFTQVNPEINQHMVNQAITLLGLQESDTVYDFFCGIGNFTLPIATIAKKVIGFEGSPQLVKRATDNAKHNNLTNAEYTAVNLFKVDNEWLCELGLADKWLIDPSRDGAAELIASISANIAPQKIVYVSCNPATLARDASILVNTHSYNLIDVGVMNMFPHTSHIESIAVFAK